MLFIHWRVVAEESAAAFGWRRRFLFYGMTCGDGRGGGELGGQLGQPACNERSPCQIIKVFHAADCANLRGEFEGWTKEQRDQLVAKLLPIMPAQ